MSFSEIGGAKYPILLKNLNLAKYYVAEFVYGLENSEAAMHVRYITILYIVGNGNL